LSRGESDGPASEAGARERFGSGHPDVPVAERDAHHVYRRRIRLVTDPGRGMVTGELEDDFHHFVARVEHDGARIVRVDGDSPRVPWTTCPGARLALRGLEGMQLSPDARQLARGVDASVHCTHWLDAAILAAAWAGRGGTGCAERVYDAAVPEVEDGVRRASLARDGRPVLEWEIEGLALRSGAPVEPGLIIGPSFSRAVDGVEDLELREAVLVLRRAVLISLAHIYDMDRVTDPMAFAAAIGARCHTFQPTRTGVVRIRGANRDFTRDPEALLRPPAGT
jgi:hypothetical protein